MPLPKIESKKYTLTIPSTGKNVEYRPFLVKEEKLLLNAQKETNTEKTLNALKEVVSNCTFNAVNIDSLTSFDLEYIFLKLRSLSVNNITEIDIQCEKCNHENKIKIDLNNVIIVDNSTKKEIMLTDNVGVNMKFLTVKDVSSFSGKDDNDQSIVMDMIIHSIDSIFDDSGVYKASDSTYSDLEEFINSLNRSQIEKIENFISSSPKLQYNTKFKCSYCKEHNSIDIIGAKALLI
jgi:hypothetical protein